VKRANLIPAVRQEHRRRVRRVTTWAKAMGVYAVVLVCAYAACFAFGDDSCETTLQQITESTQRFREAGKEIHTLRQSLAEASSQIAAARTLGQTPDWSLLLALVSKNLSDNVVLERCLLAPGKMPDNDERKPNADGQVLYQRYTLELRGFAKTQTGVSQFVLRLEKTGLFENVRMIKTQKRQFLDSEAVAFHIECILDGSGGPNK